MAKINFSEIMRGLDGEPLKEGDKPVVLKTICVNALLAGHSEANGRPENASGVEKLKRYMLAKKLYLGGEIEVSSEEIVLVKQLIEKGYGTLVVGIVSELLK